MQNYEELAKLVFEQKAQIQELKIQVREQQNLIQQQKALVGQFSEENRYLKLRLDTALNTIALQNEEIQQLKDEIATLKGQKPRPKIPPSFLEGSKSKDKQKDKGLEGRQYKRKTNQLHIHCRKRIKPEFIPEGTIFKGYQKFTVQDVIFQSYNTLYELERWQLPDGTYITGQLPKAIQGHYGPTLVTYILHQYYGCRVTEPLLFAQLKEIGVLISEGQLSNILIHSKDAFHKEKESLLPAGIAATGQIQADDTGSRHLGKNGYSTIIGNQFFTFVMTTESKSRINFLRVLHGTNPQYLINEDAADYIESIKPGSWLCGYLKLHMPKILVSQSEWDKFLLQINISAENEIRLVTEAALFASLIQAGIPRDLGVHGDDAGQFNTFIRSLCWVHEERHYRKIIPIDEKMRQVIEAIRDGIWDLYKELQEYKLAPSEDLRILLSQKFNNLFLQKTISPTLNNQLAKTYAKKSKLLRVLEKPATPLHNNVIETDARELVIKRKVSGGTRSEEGKKCRDTFVSLKKTCGKLGISFFGYLSDRINEIFEIPILTEIIASRAKED